MKRLAVLGFLVLLMVGCVVVTGCGSSGSQSKGQKTTTEETQGSTTSSDESASGNQIVEGSVGEVIKLGDIDFKVVSWRIDTWDTVGFEGDPERTPVILDLEITNHSKEGVGGNESIITPEGYAYDAVWTAPDPGFPQSDVEPGEKGRGFITIAVPNNIGTMTFQYEEFNFGKARVKLQ